MANPGSSNAPLFDEAANLMKSIQSKRADIKDEYSLYGEKIGIKLLRPQPQTRSSIKSLALYLLRPLMMPGRTQNRGGRRHRWGKAAKEIIIAAEAANAMSSSSSRAATVRTCTHYIAMWTSCGVESAEPNMPPGADRPSSFGIVWTRLKHLSSGFGHQTTVS
ncbi:hypothetical protein HHI36_014488 [Cryptolaemus montrouzieri]|uniref:Uncharacterized protein n=1 Tax=Cryptolaemus montrouzieri TaxID=559131 RepID=A0ABD2N3A2_9CUCU